MLRPCFSLVKLSRHALLNLTATHTARCDGRSMEAARREVQATGLSSDSARAPAMWQEEGDCKDAGRQSDAHGPVQEQLQHFRHSLLREALSLPCQRGRERMAGRSTLFSALGHCSDAVLTCISIAAVKKLCNCLTTSRLMSRVYIVHTGVSSYAATLGRTCCSTTPALPCLRSSNVRAREHGETGALHDARRRGQLRARAPPPARRRCRAASAVPCKRPPCRRGPRRHSPLASCQQQQHVGEHLVRATTPCALGGVTIACTRSRSCTGSAFITSVSLV